eukprot:4363215-Prymnesium_polylepis.2
MLQLSCNSSLRDIVEQPPNAERDRTEESHSKQRIYRPRKRAGFELCAQFARLLVQVVVAGRVSLIAHAAVWATEHSGAVLRAVAANAAVDSSVAREHIARGLRVPPVPGLQQDCAQGGSSTITVHAGDARTAHWRTPYTLHRIEVARLADAVRCELRSCSWCHAVFRALHTRRVEVEPLLVGIHVTFDAGRSGVAVAMACRTTTVCAGNIAPIAAVVPAQVCLDDGMTLHSSLVCKEPALNVEQGPTITVSSTALSIRTPGIWCPKATDVAERSRQNGENRAVQIYSARVGLGITAGPQGCWGGKRAETLEACLRVAVVIRVARRIDRQSIRAVTFGPLTMRVCITGCIENSTITSAVAAVNVEIAWDSLHRASDGELCLAEQDAGHADGRRATCRYWRCTDTSRSGEAAIEGAVECLETIEALVKH